MLRITWCNTHCQTWYLFTVQARAENRNRTLSMLPVSFLHFASTLQPPTLRAKILECRELYRLCLPGKLYTVISDGRGGKGYPRRILYTLISGDGGGKCQPRRILYTLISGRCAGKCYPRRILSKLISDGHVGKC